MTEAHRPPPADRDDDPPHPTPEADRRMRDFLAALPPPPSAEELARRQGKTLPLSTWDAVMRDDEDFDWGDAWDGFDEFLEEIRHGKGDVSRWLRDGPPDEEP